MKNVVLNIITTILVIIDLLLLYNFKNIPFVSNIMFYIEKNNFLSWLPLLVPSSGVFYLINYNFISPLIYTIVTKIACNFGYLKSYKSFFKSVVEKTMRWLVNIDCRWGTYENSDIMQNANTCEGILALISTGCQRKYSRIYEEALNSIVQNSTPKGLISKSLAKETVVCTSYLLIISFYDCEKNNKKVVKSLSPYKKISRLLWDCRSNCGWGTFLQKTQEQDCSIVNTFRALYAILMTKCVKPNDFNLFVKNIYALASDDSLFGFSPKDQARMTPTALSVILYYNLSSKVQNAIKDEYNVKKAIKYIIANFCKDDFQQSEIETLEGINDSNTSIKKVPWTHISSGYAIRAICLAYKNGDVSSFTMARFVKWVKKICILNIATLPNDTSYYIPNNMMTSHGVTTYSSAYLLYGLSSLLDIL